MSDLSRFRFSWSGRLLAGLGCALLLSACKTSDSTIEPAPKIGFAWITPMAIPLKKNGYEREEYFFSGTANAYTNTAPLESDGKWEVAPGGETAKYKSRMLVYRPIDPAAFNGTVIVEWMNVSSGMDTPTEWIMLHTELMRRGYAYVAVSAQYAGVEGGPIPLPKVIPLCLAVKCGNPLRYRSLSHPGDSFSYDIFHEAAELVRYPKELNPLGNLTPTHVIATGQSQSAYRLMTFANALGVSTNVFDGYFIHSRLGSGIPELGGGGSAPLAEAPQIPIMPPEVVKFREDLGRPVLNLQAETDQIPLGAYASRQDDSENFRLWEVAGSAHADRYVSNFGLRDAGNDVKTAAVTIARRPVPLLTKCPDNVSSAPQHHFVAKAAIRALNAWIVDGVAPPSLPRLEINAAADGFETDAHGNALGGVRSPYMDAPIARMSGLNNAARQGDGLCFLFGSTTMLDAVTLHALYPTHDDYVAAVTNATDEAVNTGTLLAEDAELVITAAREANIPPQ